MPSIQMGVTAVIFLASILLKEMRYLVYIRYLLWHYCAADGGQETNFREFLPKRMLSQSSTLHSSSRRSKMPSFPSIRSMQG
jgi:hypothetical protein